MSKLDKIAERISDVFFVEDWTWETFRGVPRERPFHPDGYEVRDYITRLVDDGFVDDPHSHDRGRIHLERRDDGKVEVYLRMGTYKP